MASVLTAFAAALIGGAVALPAAAAMPANANAKPAMTMGGGKIKMKNTATSPAMDKAALREMDGDTAHPFSAKTIKADNLREAAITNQLNTKEAQMVGAANHAAHVGG